MRVTDYKIYVRPGEREGKHYCNKCHTWFNHYHVEEVQESRGEFWGVPCTETVHYLYCPNCGADEYEGELYDEADIREEDEDEESD